MRSRAMSAAGILALVVLILAGSLGPAEAQTRTKIRYALGDIVTVESLPLLIAIERVKARGVDVEIISLKSEELAMQAVINGQADIGQGTPYAAIQKLSAPIRFLYQLNGAHDSLLAASGDGGVAFFAHVGGFVFGWIVTRTLLDARRIRPQPEPRRLPPTPFGAR